MSSGALIVEFVGLPGAGKSYLAARVADGLAHHGMCVWRYEDRPGPGCLSGQWFKARLTALGMVITQPRRTWRLWQAARRTTRPMHFMIMWWAFAIMRRREGCRHEVLIFDQGIAQLIWSIGYEAGASLAEPLVSIAAASDLLVHVDATSATIQRRLDNRDGSQSKLERDIPDDPSAFDRAEAAMTAIRHATSDHTRLTVTHDDDVAADACVDAIIAAIEQRRQEATT
jgi:hypothetical protein